MNAFGRGGAEGAQDDGARERSADTDGIDDDNNQSRKFELLKMTIKSKIHKDVAKINKQNASKTSKTKIMVLKVIAAVRSMKPAKLAANAMPKMMACKMVNQIYLESFMGRKSQNAPIDFQ